MTQDAWTMRESAQRSIEYDALERDSTIPLYIQLNEILKGRILKGAWSEQDYRLPTEPELCEEFDIARGTVRQALAMLENEGYVRRERGRGTFVDWSSDKLRSKSGSASNHIGFVVPYVRDSFMSTILLGIERTATEMGLSVSFRHVENDPKRQQDVIKELVDQHIPGTILYPTDSIHTQPMAELISTGYPIVLVDRYLRGIPSDYVMADHFGGALQATQHLLSLGHTHIGYVFWDDAAISMEHRAAGYRRAILEAGLSYDEGLTCEVQSYPEIPLEPLHKFLAENPQMTAIFAANDHIALAVYKTARKMGKRVPQDLALVGFGDVDLASHLDVPLTTVILPTYEMGQQAVQMLVKRLNRQVEGWQRVILPTQLVVRQSCGWE